MLPALIAQSLTALNVTADKPLDRSASRSLPL